MTQCDTNNRSDEILTTSAEFVPPALDGFDEENAGTPVNWRVAMKRAIRSSKELRQLLNLCDESPENGVNKAHSDAGITAEADFPTFVPLEYLSRIRQGDVNDPLLRQVLPVEAEDSSVTGFSSDPVGDLKVMPTTGILHKYSGRALVVATGACGIHCRYCFRREFPYGEASLAGNALASAMEYIQEHPEIDEVLLSGGDPLTLVDERLKQLIDEISSCSHVKRLRVHTRMPVVIPQRLTPELVDMFKQSRLTSWFVIHVNHPQELDAFVLERLSLLIDAGIPVLNQAVLLRGINDQVETMEALCRKLVDHRIQPYYLHQLDRVHGTSHFEVPRTVGLELVAALRERLPGYAVPQYVIEEQGKKSKTPIH